MSVIEIFPFDDWSKKRLDSLSFPIAQILGTKEAISRDINVLILGYPIIVLVLEQFSAFVLNYNFASGLITLNRADTQTPSNFQCVQNPAIKGTSGGPAIIGFSRSGLTVGPPQTIVVGIVHGTFSDTTCGKLSLITQAYYIMELFK